METKVILFTIHLTLGIISSIIYLICCYKKYKVLTLADIIASLLIISGWPVFLAVHYFLFFLSNLEKIKVLKKK